MAGSADGVQDAACNGETLPADDHSALAARSAATLRRDAELQQPQEPVAAEPSWAPKQVSKLIKRLSGEKGTSKLRQGESITRPPRYGGWIQIGCSRDLRPRTRNHNNIQKWVSGFWHGLSCSPLALFLYLIIVLAPRLPGIARKKASRMMLEELRGINPEDGWYTTYPTYIEVLAAPY